MECQGVEAPIRAGIEYIVTLNNTPLDISSDFKNTISFDDKENVKSETKSPKVKTLSEEKPSFTTVSNEERSERSAEVQQGNATES